ncbi:MAG: hypothetical protein ACYS21_03200, partial [Planctomycetota bacterium]
MTKKAILKTTLIVSTFFLGVQCLIAGGSVVVVDDMEDYNDRDDIREVWRDGYADVVWGGTYPFLYLVQGGSSGSNLNASSEVGSPYEGSTAPIHGGNQAMVLYYDNDGLVYQALPGEEKWVYDAPYYSEIEANTVGNNSLDVGQTWDSEGVKWLSLSFQGHPLSDGYYDASAWPAYTVYGRGRDIQGRHDEFYFLSQYPFIGAGSIQAQVLSVDNTDPWAKAGVMIREKRTPYSKYAAVFMTPGQGVTFQYREVEDGPTTTITKPGVSAPQFVRLVRNISGAFEAKHSDNIFVWQDVNAPNTEPTFPEIAMGTIDDPNIYVGSAVTSNNANQICAADFNNLLMSPLPPNWIWGNIGTNDPEQLYVALSDGTNTSVVEHDDANAATLTEWQEWNIELTEFSGVDFNSVKKIYIGFGDRDAPVLGGSGIVYFDDIRLSISCEQSPGNDCGDPVQVTLGLAVLPYTDTNTTCGRGDDYNDTCLGDYDDGEDIIYEVNVAEAMDVNITLDPCGTTYTGIAIDDSCPPASTCIKYSRNDPATVHGFCLHLEPGLYYIMVDTWPLPDCIPEFTLIIEETTAPANDDCANAQAVGDVVDQPFDTTCATFDGGGHCTTAQNIWYCYTATCTGYVTVSLCGSSYDTMLAVYNGCACYPTFDDRIECDDDSCGRQSEITFWAVDGNDYLIEVGGYWSDAGQGLLSIWCDQLVCERGDYIDPGSNQWTCPDANFVFASGDDGCLTEIPADFFGPGSDPFEGAVSAMGHDPLSDATILRTAQGHVPPPFPSSDAIPIELLELNLQSAEPITVTYNGGLDPEEWDVTVDLSVWPAPWGTLNATKTHCNGGTYTSELSVQPRFTFTKSADPCEVRVFDTGFEGVPPIDLNSVGPC